MRIRNILIITTLATMIAFVLMAYASVTSAQSATCQVRDYTAATEEQVFALTTQHQIGNVVFYESKWTRDWATSQSMFDIDHHVSKSEAIALELCAKSAAVQKQFAQDPLNLYATNPGFNRGKGNRTPAQIADIRKTNSLVKTTLRDQDKATAYCAIRHAVLDKYDLGEPETETACVNWLVYGQATAPTPVPTAAP
ncbi:MAG: hypothetical protein OXF79_22170 [Chloroflexi bacterium]|nr:hypothetical protein [Chloroflexota bacterium]